MTSYTISRFQCLHGAVHLQQEGIQLLEIAGFLSTLQVIDCHMLIVPWGENLEQRSVSIAVWWLLLAPSPCQ